jgi:UDP-N-acetylmuramate--alanine ligase
MSVFNNQIQTFFDIKIPSGKSFDCCLKMPGEKNVIDAVMAFALTYELCGNLDKCIFGVNNLPVIERRFEVCHTYKETIIVDDEGDSPEVIKNVFQNIKSFYPNKKIFAVLQPHRFSRLNSLFEDYVNVMANNSDDIIVLPVFSAGEFQNESEKNSGTLVDSLIEKNFPRNKIHLLDIEEAILLLKKYIGKSYVIITLGPGDVWRIAHAFREK